MNSYPREYPMTVIREYMPDDYAGVRTCYVELQEHERQMDPNLADADTIADSYLEHVFTQCRTTDGGVYVAEVDGRVAGFAGVWARVVSEEPDEYRYEYAHLCDLVVLAEFRGRGLGRALLQRAEKHARARGATTLRLGVLAANNTARRLYTSAGFQGYLEIMAKDLRDANQEP
jgi:ribosomal protein S18 acetylase RimI-like enzyme